jgi:hypothetical protein
METSFCSQCRYHWWTKICHKNWNLNLRIIKLSSSSSWKTNLPDYVLRNSSLQYSFYFELFHPYLGTSMVYFGYIENIFCERRGVKQVLMQKS